MADHANCLRFRSNFSCHDELLIGSPVMEARSASCKVRIGEELRSSRAERKLPNAYNPLFSGW